MRDKDIGDLWRLMAVAGAGETARVIKKYVNHPEIGPDLRQSIEWTAAVLHDP